MIWKLFSKHGIVTTQNYAVPPHSTSPIMSATQPPPSPKTPRWSSLPPPSPLPSKPRLPSPFWCPPPRMGRRGTGKGETNETILSRTRKGKKKVFLDDDQLQKSLLFLSSQVLGWVRTDIPSPPRAIIESGGGSSPPFLNCKRKKYPFSLTHPTIFFFLLLYS